jgi:DNA-binding CsgD family transcriptional regulator
MLSNHEREQHVLDLYTQGKNTREIAKELRMSFRDIARILKKGANIERGNSQGPIQQLQGSNGTAALPASLPQHSSDKATQAYKLFSQGKTPVEVAIELGVGEKQTSRFFKEFWTLKHQHGLHSLYEEIKNDVPVFLKLHRLLKQHGMKIGNLEWFVDMVLVGAYNIPSLDNDYKNLKNDIGSLEYRKERLNTDIGNMKNEIATLRQAESAYKEACDARKEDIQYLNHEKAQLQHSVTNFKTGNKGYLEIKGIVQEHVNYLLTQRKTILTIAIVAVIEALKMNLDTYMTIFVDSNKDEMLNDSNSILSIYLKEAFSNYQTNQAHNAIVAEIAEAFCNRLSTVLVNETMTSAAMAP